MQDLMLMHVSELNDMNVQDTLWCWITCNKVKVLIGAVYRKDSRGNFMNNKLLNVIEKAAEMAKGNIIVCGDFNLPKINWQVNRSSEGINNMSSAFLQQIQDSSLKQVVTEPTRRRGGNIPSVLDLILVDVNAEIINLEHQMPLGKSDHDVLVWDYVINVKKVDGRPRFRHDFEEARFQNFRGDLENLNWNEMYELESVLVDRKWKIFKSTLKRLIDLYVPNKAVNSSQDEIPMWWNKEAGKSVKNKACAWKRYLANKTNQNYREYVKKRDQNSKILRRIKRNFEYFLGKNIKKKRKLFYKYANSKNKSKIPILKLKTNGNRQTETDEETSEVLNDYFHSTFNLETDKDLLYFSDFAKMFFMDEEVEPFNYRGPTSRNVIADIQIEVETVRKALRSLNPHKAMGPDGLHSRILIEVADQIAEPLTHIYNASIRSGICPSEWKCALVTAIFKKGDRQLPSNYRPISLTCQVCKILEKLIRDKIMLHMEKNNLICSQQHGFCKAKSCLTNLLETFEDWTLWDDNNISFDAAFLDFQKAFDSVPHCRLVYKLKKLGIQGNLLNWIEDFLSDRRQKVIVNGAESDWKNVTSGVPQGSVIGPLLFICYINDLPYILDDCLCKIFADDCKIYNKVGSQEDQDAMRRNLLHLLDWSDEYMLYFNVNKCKIMHFGRNNPKNSYSMKNQELQETDEEIDLGVVVNSDLTFTSHIDRSISKANQALGIVRRTFSYLSEELFRNIYLTYIRPHIEYCAQVWSPYLRGDIEKLEKFQRRATKLVPTLSELPYEERLARLQIPTLESRRSRGDLIEAFKILKGHENVDRDRFFQSRVYARELRGNNHMLQKQNVNKEKRKNVFSQRVVNEWNSLPNDVIEATSVNLFKKRLDLHRE